MTQTTPSTSAQGPDERPANCRHRLQDEGKPYPRSSCTACGKGIVTGLGRYCTVSASPSPAASPASPSVDAVAQIIAKWVDEKRYADAPAFQMAAREIIASLASDATPAPKCTYCGDTGTITDRVDGEITCPECGYATPAPTSGSEDGVESLPVVATLYVARGGATARVVSGLENGRDEYSELVRLADVRALAKPASEPAGGVGVDARVVEAVAKEMRHYMETAHDGVARIPPSVIANWRRLLSETCRPAALSSSAAPAEAVAWMIQYENGCRNFYVCEQLALSPGHKQTPLYAHPAPATVELTDAMIEAGQRYIRGTAFKGEHDLPVQFRWHELWDAMMRAALAPATEGRKG